MAGPSLPHVSIVSRLARWRVPLGFSVAGAAAFLAAPTPTSWWVGTMVALPGALLRLWAAGHIEKGREITRSGPYRYVRHPLYLGSALLGAGFAIVSTSALVMVLALCYLGLTLAAAIRTEEATLDARFPGQYAAYRAGAVSPAERRFAWERAWRNREYRALSGFVVAFAFLWWKATR